jgi:AmmeMemoRadiSam system protein B
MASVRHPAVAGTFYPADPDRLRRDVETLLSQAPPYEGPPPAGLIVPHAGYVYSGPVAATAFAALGPAERALVVGPAHFVPCRGLVLPGVDLLRTPLGDLPVDRETEEALLKSRIVSVDPRPHGPEHSVEVQFPFLQVLFADMPVAALLAGAVSFEETAAVIGPFLEDDGTAVVISSDLSHYHAYATARRLDEKTVSVVEAGDPEALGVEAACGLTGIQAVVAAAGEAGLSVRCLDLRNSGDTAGPRDRVVGYGAFVIA